MKLKNQIVSKGREFGNMLSQERAFWTILHKTSVAITCLVPNAAGNMAYCDKGKMLLDT